MAFVAGCVLTLAYKPALADPLEAYLLLQPAPLPQSPANHAPNMEWDSPGIDQPSVVSADKAALDDDTPVIGVLASGKARAYLVEAFDSGPSVHVVNDVLAGVPISVTRCNISGCIRLFTGPTLGHPLGLSTGGRKDRRLLVKFNGRTYRQETSQPLDEASSPFPYTDYPAELMEWGQWRRQHPQTDVYMGCIEEALPIEAAKGRIMHLIQPAGLTHHRN